MKYKWLSLISIAGVLLLGVVISVQGSSQKNRYYQHEQPLPTQACPTTVKELCTHLPILEINTGGQMPVIQEDEYDHEVSSEILVDIKIIDHQTTMNRQSDKATMSSQAVINYRGNSSLNFDKKSYKVNFVNADLSDAKLPFLGMKEHDEWVLNGPFLDKTLMRNYLAHNIAGEIMDYSVAVRYFELIVNGEYQGLYLAMESIDQGIDRVNISEYDPKMNNSSYILRADRQIGKLNEIDNFTKYAKRIGSSNAFEIIYPSKNKLTPELKRTIERDFSRFEKTLYSFDYNERKFGYWSYIDVNSFVDYFIINEFFQNSDAGIYSTYYYRDLRGKINIGPVWDFNNALDNYMEEPFPVNGFFFLNRIEYFMLMKDDFFIEAIIQRYDQLRKEILSEERVIRMIDETHAYIGDAILRNDEKWGYSFDVSNLDELNKLYPDERNLKSYDEALIQMKTRLIDRGKWLDKNIGNLRQYCHESKVKKFNH